MEINEASKKFVNEFLNLKGVYGVDYYKCKCCDNTWNIRVDMDTNDLELMKKIPDNYEGFRVEKNFSTQSVAQELKDNKPQANHVAKEFVDKYLNAQRMIYGAAANRVDNTIDVLMDTTNKNIMALVPDSFKGVKVNKIQSEPIKSQTETKITRVKITPKGQMYWQKAPITGGYIPEDIFVLLLIKDGKSYDLDYLKTSKRKLQNFDGLITYLFAKGLISINDATSPQAEDYSNVRGGRGGGGRRGGGRRRVVVRRPNPRGSFQGSKPRQQLNYVRRNYNRFGYGYALPSLIYVYDETTQRQPKTIIITRKGLFYLKQGKRNPYSYFLSAISNGAAYDDVVLRKNLQLNNWNNVVNKLYVGGLIKIK